MTMTPAMAAAADVVGTLLGCGVTDFVVCPGARSQALALTVAALAETGDVRLHVRIDERSAGFLALGLAIESGRPAPVITTSGSAVANLLPAIVEAHHANVPMIALTADRPARLRGTGANQTTVQPAMFAAFVRWECDVAPPTPDAPGPARDSVVVAQEAWNAATSGEPGPVHVNLQFVEPLSSAADALVIERARAARTSVVADGAPRMDGGADSADPQDGATAGTRVTLSPGPRTIVIAGADAGERAEEVAHAGAWPLIAEVSSGARYGRNLVVHYRDALTDPELGGLVERALVFGHPTLSRQVAALLERTDVDIVRIGARDEVVVIAPDGDAEERPTSIEWLRTWQRWDRAAQAQHDAVMAQASPAARAPDVDTSRARSAQEQREFVTGELAAARAPITRELLVSAVWRVTWPHDRLMFGASRLVRVADATVPGKKISVHANRGLSGIDGNIGTAIGIALAAEPALTRVLLGDVAALHDAGSLLFPVGEARPRIQVVVGNDGGGSIFDQLEVAATADQTAFDRVMFTPQDAQFEHLALAYGWRYARVSTMGELEAALIGASDGPELIEVALER
jgi:2-succinyl-5-enolpyruvyl-6-hydroxy-3-cyclohexene-1-carboxylate synthase